MFSNPFDGISANALEVIYMVIGSLGYVVNDALIRVATDEGLDVYQALCLRGIGMTVLFAGFARAAESRSSQSDSLHTSSPESAQKSSGRRCSSPRSCTSNSRQLKPSCWSSPSLSRSLQPLFSVRQSALANTSPPKQPCVSRAHKHPQRDEKPTAAS